MAWMQFGHSVRLSKFVGTRFGDGEEEAAGVDVGGTSARPRPLFSIAMPSERVMPSKRGERRARQVDFGFMFTAAMRVSSRMCVAAAAAVAKTIIMLLTSERHRKLLMQCG